MINDADSCFGGRPHLGCDTCPNQKWRVTLRAQDGDGQDLKVDAAVSNTRGIHCESGETECRIYLKNGVYFASGIVDGQTLTTDFAVVDGPEEVILGSKEGTLDCRVKDSQTRRLLAGAAVELLQEEAVVASGSTDADGALRLQAAEGSYLFKVSRAGYDLYTEEISIEAGRLLTVTVKLTPEEEPETEKDTETGSRAIRRRKTGTPLGGQAANAMPEILEHDLLWYAENRLPFKMQIGDMVIPVQGKMGDLLEAMENSSNVWLEGKWVESEHRTEYKYMAVELDKDEYPSWSGHTFYINFEGDSPNEIRVDLTSYSEKNNKLKDFEYMIYVSIGTDCKNNGVILSGGLSSTDLDSPSYDDAKDLLRQISGFEPFDGGGVLTILILTVYLQLLPTCQLRSQ